MKWVTRDFVHIDRVAAPWLIRRFIDLEATFVFLPSGGSASLPEDAIPFGLPDVELAAHDESGSTFRKILQKYELNSPALLSLAEMVEDAIRYYLNEKLRGGGDIARLACPEAVGLVAFSEGMLYAASSDQENIDLSMPLYDALYDFCQIKLIEAHFPDDAKGPPYKVVPVLKPRLQRPPNASG